MKKQVSIILLLAMLVLAIFSGCSAAGIEERVDAVEDKVEDRMDAVEDMMEKPMDALEDAVEDSVQTAALPEASQPTAGNATGAALTREQAEAIALEHAGFTADQVSYLRTEYEIDDGIAQYEVSFHEGRWEYDYEINAETGAIISFEKDD